MHCCHFSLFFRPFGWHCLRSSEACVVVVVHRTPMYIILSDVRILIALSSSRPQLGARTCRKTFTKNYLQQFFTVFCHNFSHTAATEAAVLFSFSLVSIPLKPKKIAKKRVYLGCENITGSRRRGLPSCSA